MALKALKRLIQGDDQLWLAAAKIFVGNGNGFASAVAPTGDMTLDSAGSFAIGTSKIVGKMINSAVVSAGHITNATVSVTKMAASAITAPKLAYTTISATIPVGNASTTSCYASLAVTSGAKLMGIWLNTIASHAIGSFFFWVSNYTAAIRIDITSNCGLTTSLVFKGVVIEP